MNNAIAQRPREQMEIAILKWGITSPAEREGR